MYIKGSYIKYRNIVSYIAPYIVQQPIGATIGIGDSFTFRIKAKGTNITYKWYKNGFIITGENSDTFSIINATGDDEDYYYCIVSNNSGSIRSDRAFLTVSGAVYIVTQPVSVTVNPRETISFNISAIGTEPITYRWYKNDILIPSATTDTLYINNVGFLDEAEYYCIASNIINSRISDIVQLNLNKEIIIVNTPTDATYNAGQVLNTYLSCTGATPISAQWRKNGVNYKPLIITNTGKVDLYILLDNNDEGSYDCVLTNVVGSVTSTAFNIYVNKSMEFVVQPVSGTVNTGDSFTFTVEVKGTEPFYYKWIKDNPYVDLGITGNTLILNNIEVSDEAEYKCVVSNDVGTLTSLGASLSVTSEYLISQNSDYILFDNNTYWKLN